MKEVNQQKLKCADPSHRACLPEYCPFATPVKKEVNQQKENNPFDLSAPTKMTSKKERPNKVIIRSYCEASCDCPKCHNIDSQKKALLEKLEGEMITKDSHPLHANLKAMEEYVKGFNFGITKAKEIISESFKE